MSYIVRCLSRWASSCLPSCSSSQVRLFISARISLTTRSIVSSLVT